MCFPSLIRVPAHLQGHALLLLSLEIRRLRPKAGVSQIFSYPGISAQSALQAKDPGTALRHTGFSLNVINLILQRNDKYPGSAQKTK